MSGTDQGEDPWWSRGFVEGTAAKWDFLYQGAGVKHVDDVWEVIGKGKTS
jgi:hypothetical protein